MAVNPYQLYPIYDADHVKKYKNRKLGDLPPHIFAVADNAYSHMKREAHDQCVIIRYAFYSALAKLSYSPSFTDTFTDYSRWIINLLIRCFDM